MDSRIERNKQFLTDLFTRRRNGMALIASGHRPWHLSPGDVSVVTDRPVSDWLAFYEADYASRVELSESVDDDAVPYVALTGTTGFFAAAFGCPFHSYEHGSIPVARPIVTSADQADALAQPTLDDGPIPRYFELVDRLVERLGPNVPLSVPDVQSPFGIAAIVWRKEDFLVAMIEQPQAVQRLTAKAYELLASFIDQLKRRAPNVNLCHCPYAWAPPEMGVWLSEDEIGAFNTQMFREFCLPWLAKLSDRFGGLFMHCCASAGHQYEAWRDIPRLHAINPAIFEAGPAPLIDTMPEKVFMYGCQTEETMMRVVDVAHEQTGLLFEVGGQRDEIRRTLERLRTHHAARWASATARSTSP